MAGGGKQPSRAEATRSLKLAQGRVRAAHQERESEKTDDWADDQSGSESDSRVAEAHEAQKSAYEDWRMSNSKRRWIVEKIQAEHLKQSQAYAAKQSSSGSPAGGMPEGGFPTLPNTPPKPANLGGGEDGGGGSQAEQLSRSQSEAANKNAMMGGATADQQSLEGALGGAGGGGESMDPKKKIQTQIDSINHYLVVEIMPEVLSCDVACFGLISFITLPLFYWPVAAIIGLEVYNDFTGAEPKLPGTMFPWPKLTWKSFMSPGGTEIEIPLPTQPLWLAWIAYVAFIGCLSIVWLGLLGLIIYIWSDPLQALSNFGEMLPFFSSMIGL